MMIAAGSAIGTPPFSGSASTSSSILLHLLEVEGGKPLMLSLDGKAEFGAVAFQLPHESGKLHLLRRRRCGGLAQWALFRRLRRPTAGCQEQRRA
jgi:hypothetical protein